MLIISKFKDYYDSVAQSKGIDKTIVYKRLTEEKALKEYYTRWNVNNIYFPNYSRYKYSASSKKSDKNVESFKTYLIGFCGKIYPLLILNSGDYHTKITTSYIYDLEEIKSLNDQYCPSYKSNYFSDFTKHITDKKTLELFFVHKTPIFKLGKVSVDLNGEPIRGHNDKNFTTNVNLKELEFFKIVNSYSAFQEIEMFISGVLGTQSQNTIEVSDKSKIEGHGFDYRTSFRKEKDNN